jgi:hypothetical protein
MPGEQSRSPCSASKKASAENDRPRPAPQFLQQVGFFLKALRLVRPEAEYRPRGFPEAGIDLGPHALRSQGRKGCAAVGDQERATWRASTPIDWANESFAIWTSPSVGYCVRADDAWWYGASNKRLDEGEAQRTVVVDRVYIEAHARTVREQLVKAGMRLAGLLNQALGVTDRGRASSPLSLPRLARPGGRPLTGSIRRFRGQTAVVRPTRTLARSPGSAGFSWTPAGSPQSKPSCRWISLCPSTRVSACAVPGACPECARPS